MTKKVSQLANQLSITPYYMLYIVFKYTGPNYTDSCQMESGRQATKVYLETFVEGRPKVFGLCSLSINIHQYRKSEKQSL